MCRLYSHCMRYCFILVLSLIATCLRAQAQAPARTETVVSAASRPYSDAGTDAAPAGQAQHWKLLAAQRPADAGAWFNYYLWASRDKSIQAGQKQKDLDAIVSQAGMHISGSALYDLMVYLQSGKKDTASLRRVMASESEKAVTRPYIIQFLADRAESALLKKYCLEYEAASPLPEDLYQYHYNVLMSAGHNATIYAKGVTDLVPLAVLQQVHGIRNDLRLRTYTGSIGGDTAAYLCLSVGKETLAGYPEGVYTGLLVKITGDLSPAELERHMLTDFDRTYLSGEALFSPGAPLLYRNYLPALVLLYNYYKATGNAKAPDIKNMIGNIAGQAGRLSEIHQLTGE